MFKFLMMFLNFSDMFGKYGIVNQLIFSILTMYKNSVELWANESKYQRSSWSAKLILIYFR